MYEDTSLPCAVSNLDWIAYDQGPITVKAGKSSQKRNPFRRQIEMCNQCAYQEPCLELGLEEEWGIWGGKFPYERRAIRRRRESEGPDTRSIEARTEMRHIIPLLG